MIGSEVDWVPSVPKLLSVFPLGWSVVPVMMPQEAKIPWVQRDEIQTHLQRSAEALLPLVHLTKKSDTSFPSLS